MASPSETTLILLGAGAVAGVIDRDSAAFWQAVTALGLTVTPLLAAVGRWASRRVDARARDAIPPVGRRGPHRHLRLWPRRADGRRDARRRTTAPISRSTATSTMSSRAREAGFAVLFGDVARRELLEQLELGEAAAVVLTMDDPVLTARITRQLRADHRRRCRSSPARATPTMPPRSTAPGSATPSPRRSRRRCNCPRRCWSTSAWRWAR